MLDFLYKKAFNWFSGKSVFIKITSMVILATVVLVLIRIEYLGTPLADLSRRLVPISIPIVDVPPEATSLSLYLERFHCTKGKYVRFEGPIMLDPSDNIRISFGAVRDAYIAVFGIDGNGVFGIFPEITKSGNIAKIEGTKLPGMTLNTQKFQLSKYPGVEVIIALGADRPFKAISAEYVLSHISVSSSKGPAGVYTLPLDNDSIRVKSISYRVSKSMSECHPKQ